MMEPEDIKTMADAQRYVEGCVNDFEGGISTKLELLRFMHEYTVHVMDVASRSTTNAIRKDPSLLDES